MGTLERIKDEVASEQNYHDGFGNKITDWGTFAAMYGKHDTFIDEIAKRYAKAILEKAAENAKVKIKDIVNLDGFEFQDRTVRKINYVIDKESITSTELD